MSTKTQVREAIDRVTNAYRGMRSKDARTRTHHDEGAELLVSEAVQALADRLREVSRMVEALA